MRLRPTQWLVIAFFLLLIFYPEFHCTKRISPFGILLLDRSESMKRATLPKIDSPFPLKRFDFGSEHHGTAIGEGLLQAKDRYEEASFILLYSDGSNTVGENPIEAAAEIGIPVYTMHPNITLDTSGYISAFGPEIIKEGDNAVYKVHYRVLCPSTINVLEEGVLDKKEVEGEGMLEFALNPTAGRHTFEFNLSKGDRIIDRTYRNLLVKKRPRVLIYTGSLDWNYKFFYRYFKELGSNVSGVWNRDDFDSPFSDYEIVCLINPKIMVEEKIGDYIKNGGKTIVVNSSMLSTDFLPFIAPTITTVSSELPIHHYLKPTGIRRGSRSIDIMGEKLVYMLDYGEGQVAQVACLDPWRLRLAGGGVYKRDLFGEMMDKLLKYLTPAKLNISYPERLLEGEELKVTFEPMSPDSFIWDGHAQSILEDYIIISSPERGIHHFKVVFPSSTFIESLKVMSGNNDGMGVDITMLDAISSGSGGGKWEDGFDQSLFGYKEKELYINLRHNWFFLSIFFIILFFDWYLWMRGK